MIEASYHRFRRALKRARAGASPYARRLMRLLALPYCYFGHVRGKECAASPLRVASDLLSVFFRLKYYPDNYSLCRFWSVDRNRWRLYYGSMYDAYQRARLEREIQSPEYRVVFADKEICQRLCLSLDLPVPKLLGCLEPGGDGPAAIRAVLAGRAGREIIVKPVRGAGGRGVVLVAEEGGEAVVYSGGKKTPLAALRIDERSVMQERVHQHDGMAAIYAGAVNTIRVQTLLTLDGETIVLGAAARFGRNRSRVDNMCSGGIGVGVHVAQGRLMAVGRDFACREYDRHPESGVKFDGYPVPYWKEAVDLVRRAQSFFPFYRLLGFDIAITPDGPLIIEINPEPDNVFIEECYGPILADPRVAIEFDRYGLLINRPSRALAAEARRAMNAR